MTENPYQNPLEGLKDKVSEISSSKEKKWGLACYIPILNLVGCCVTAVVQVKSKFCLFHARQGLILFCSWFVTLFLGLFIPVLGLLLSLALIGLHVYGLVIVSQGAMTKIPFVGNLAMKIPEKYIFTLLTQKTVEDDSQEDQKEDGKVESAGENVENASEAETSSDVESEPKEED